MSNSGPGPDPRGSSWDNPSWPTSLSDSSLSRPDEQPPNPWSREGSGDGSGPASAPSAVPEPVDPYAAPAPDPGYDPQPTPPYGNGATSYAPPTPAYGDPNVNGYAAPPPAYGSNPYELNPYQPAYGSAGPYGVPPASHPQSTTALVLGILGIVFGLSCGVGGFLGIGGITMGRRARAEIDAQPGRYEGRSQAVAGIVTGTIGLVVGILTVVVVVLVIVVGVTTGEF